MLPDVQDLLGHISTGFRVSVPEAIITSVVIFGFIFGLVYYYITQQRRERLARQEAHAARYDRLLRSVELPVGAVALLDRLAAHLKDPSKPFLLLESEGTFNTCLRRLQERESVSPALVAAIRLRLGYDAKNPERAPLSSGDIAEDSPIVLERIGGTERERLPARVTEVTEGYLAVELKGENQVARGDCLNLYFYNSVGLYALTTRVLGSEGATARLAHSTKIKSVQRRRYYRRKLDAPAYLRRADSEDGFIKTLLQDLGGGGAKMVNPHDIFERGDQLEIALDPDRGRWIRVPGTVVRVGRDATISVRFGALRESVRDRIIRSLFRRYTASQQERSESNPEASSTEKGRG